MDERPKDADSPLVFLIGGRGQRRLEALSYDGLVKMFTRATTRAGIREVWVTPHALINTPWRPRASQLNKAGPATPDSGKSSDTHTGSRRRSAASSVQLARDQRSTPYGEPGAPRRPGCVDTDPGNVGHLLFCRAPGVNEDPPCGRRGLLTCPHNHARELRPVRPVRAATLPENQGPGEDHAVPDRAEVGRAVGLAGRRAPADAAAEPGLDQRELGRPAPRVGVDQVRAGHRVADRRGAVGVLPAEHHGRRAEGVRVASTHDLRRPLSGRRGLPEADHPPVEQGRVAARAAPGPALRSRRGVHLPAPDGTDRVGVGASRC